MSQFLRPLICISLIDVSVERFKELAEYRTQLTNLMGPLFSDPLRTLKRKIKAGDSDVKRKLGGAVDSSEAKKQKQ